MYPVTGRQPNNLACKQTRWTFVDVEFGCWVWQFTSRVNFVKMSSKGQTPWKDLRLATVSSAKFRQVELFFIMEEQCYQLSLAPNDFNWIWFTCMVKFISKCRVSRMFRNELMFFRWISLLFQSLKTAQGLGQKKTCRKWESVNHVFPVK